MDGKPAPKFAVRTEFRIELTGDGDATTVRLRSLQEPGGALKGWLMKRLGTKDIARNLDRSLERLAALVRAVKVIGLLGGMSWESSAEYYKIVNERVRERLGGLHSAHCVMYSVDFAEIEELQASGRWDEAGQAARRTPRQALAAPAPTSSCSAPTPCTRSPTS